MDESGKRLRHYLMQQGIEQKYLAEKLNLPKQYINSICVGRKNVSKSLAPRIQEAIGVSAAWLLTGYGSMYSDQPEEDANIMPEKVSYDAVTQPSPSMRPYYNVDFAAGFALMENDQTINPDFLIDCPQYRDCDLYCNVYGDSMMPTISSGDIVAMKRVDDFRYLINGKIYGIVTSNGLRTIKRIRDNGDTFTLVPDNQAVGEQTIPKSYVTNIYLVIGVMKTL